MAAQPASDERSVRGRVAVITGAASGMGRATAELFAEEGAHVALSDRDGAGAEAVAGAIREAGGSAQAWTLDVGLAEEVRRHPAAVAERFGRIDILVNNAGFARQARPEPAGTEAGDAFSAYWTDALAVMLSGQQELVRAALPWLRQSDAPRIVNIASTEGLGATPGNTPYVAAKHGVIGLTRGLAADLGREGITVNCVCPGPVNTAITSGIPDADKATFARRRTALRRYGEPREVAHITLSCAMPAASFLCGAVIPVDGGLLVRNA